MFTLLRYNPDVKGQVPITRWICKQAPEYSYFSVFFDDAIYKHLSLWERLYAEQIGSSIWCGKWQGQFALWSSQCSGWQLSMFIISQTNTKQTLTGLFLHFHPWCLGNINEVCRCCMNIMEWGERREKYINCFLSFMLNPNV